MSKGLDYVINLIGGNSEGVDHAKKRIGEVDGAIAGAESRGMNFAKVIGGLGVLVGGLFATEKIIDFGKESLQAAKSIREATAQVAQGMETTGNAAGHTLDDFLERAEKLKHTTLFSKADALIAESQLETFTSIKGVVFDDAIPAIMGLATRMGGDGPADLKGSLLQVSKAMQDPERNLGRLQRSGVDFTEAQKKLITGLQEHNHLAEAQKLIIAEVNREFGGSAEAARKAAGPQADLKEAYDGLLEALGPLLQQGLAPLVTWMAKGVNEAASLVGKLSAVGDIAKKTYGWIEKYADAFEDLAIGIGISMGLFALANPIVIAYTGGLILNGIASAGLTVVTWALTAAQWAYNAAVTDNPIGLIIVAIGAVIGAVIYAVKHWDAFRAVLVGVGEVAKVLIDIFLGLGKTILGALTFDKSMIADGLVQGAQAIAEIRDKGFIGIFNRGHDESMADSKKQEAKDNATDAAVKPVGGENVKKPVVAQTGTETTKKPAIPHNHLHSHNSSGVTSGTIRNESVAKGNSVKHITITIQSMVKEFNQTINNLQGKDGADLKRMVTQLFMAAAQDAEILLGAE